MTGMRLLRQLFHIKLLSGPGQIMIHCVWLIRERYACVKTHNHSHSRCNYKNRDTTVPCGNASHCLRYGVKSEPFQHRLRQTFATKSYGRVLGGFDESFSRTCKGDATENKTENKST